jgi:hypothetical protein
MISSIFTGKIATFWGLMSCSLATLSKPAALIFKEVFEYIDNRLLRSV